MRIESERMKEREATAELIRQLVRDDALRGEFMILFDEADDENFVQIACDYDDVGGKSDGCFDLEYRAGQGTPIFHCTRRVDADAVERIFLDELDGRAEWRQDFSWERQDIGGFSVPQLGDMPMVARVLCVVGCAGGVLLLIILLVGGLGDLISVLRKPGATPGDFVGVGVFVLVPAIFLGGALRQLVKCLKSLGKERRTPGRMNAPDDANRKRSPHELSVAADGLGLGRCLPPGFVFLAFWCVLWNSFVFGAIFTKNWVYDGPANGIGDDDVIGVLFPLIGIGMVVFWLWLLRKHLRPSYEVRIVGGTVKEGERATFEYRFKGDPESVKRVEFATALDLGFGNGSLGTPPGEVNDEKEFSNPQEIATGRVSLGLPRAPDDSDMHPKFYFRAKVVFEHGPSATSSYCIPL